MALSRRAVASASRAAATGSAVTLLSATLRRASALSPRGAATSSAASSWLSALGSPRGTRGNSTSAVGSSGRSSSNASQRWKVRTVVRPRFTVAGARPSPRRARTHASTPSPVTLRWSQPRSAPKAR